MLADEKFQKVLGVVGADNPIDADHVYAAYLKRCDYSLTENPDHFTSGGRREQLEGILGLKIRRTGEFLAEMSNRGDSSKHHTS